MSPDYHTMNRLFDLLEDTWPLLLFFTAFGFLAWLAVYSSDGQTYLRCLEKVDDPSLCAPFVEPLVR